MCLNSTSLERKELHAIAPHTLNQHPIFLQNSRTDSKILQISHFCWSFFSEKRNSKSKSTDKKLVELVFWSCWDFLSIFFKIHRRKNSSTNRFMKNCYTARFRIYWSIYSNIWLLYFGLEICHMGIHTYIFQNILKLCFGLQIEHSSSYTLETCLCTWYFQHLTI